MFLKPTLAVTVMFTLLFVSPAIASEDDRQLVSLPPMMQHHMLQNMRDHLAALGEILAALEEGQNDQAGKIAESRLGISSLQSHGASHMAPYMPDGMRAAGTAMHRAASRFATVLQDSEMEETVDAARMIHGVLRAITDACNACHSGYRIR